MATNSTGTGSSVELSVFRSWGKDNVIGHEIKIRNDKQLVTKVWCKLCTRHSKAIQSHPSWKGPARKRQCWRMLTEHRTLQNATLCGI